ncbi:MAG: hypothetical protein QQW96_07785 [Tychonema bourrellyi B0820]|nr:hypothetical protein [Tychonema bourrellyi B0820]
MNSPDYWQNIFKGRSRHDLELGMGHRASGMGHRAWGIGHRAWGMGIRN